MSKEEVEAEKARLKAVDARPIKKVAEAKARQHKKAVSRLQTAREKAESIAAQVRADVRLCVCDCLLACYL